MLEYRGGNFFGGGGFFFFLGEKTKGLKKKRGDAEIATGSSFSGGRGGQRAIGESTLAETSALFAKKRGGRKGPRALNEAIQKRFGGGCEGSREL